MIFKMAFSVKAVGGGLCGSIVASMMSAMRFGVARGVFSNEAGMGSAAITAAAATTDNPVRQGYINMTGTFWDTIVVCTITGPVSYTHLDVYKRQVLYFFIFPDRLVWYYYS